MLIYINCYLKVRYDIIVSKVILQTATGWLAFYSNCARNAIVAHFHSVPWSRQRARKSFGDAAAHRVEIDAKESCGNPEPVALVG